MNEVAELRSRSEFLGSENTSLTQKLVNAEVQIAMLESKVKQGNRNPVKVRDIHVMRTCFSRQV